MALEDIYGAYIACINERSLERLGDYVADSVIHNGRPLGLAGYRDMLLGDYRDIPDLRFVVQLLVSDTTMVCSRLHFDCHPAGTLRGVQVDGRRVVFHENVMYRFAAGKIQEVWSVIDRGEIEANLEAPSA